MHKPLLLRRSVQSIACDGGPRRLESELKSRQVSLLPLGGDTIGNVGGQQKYLTKVSPHADCAGARVGGGVVCTLGPPATLPLHVVNDLSSAVGTRGTHMHAHPVWHGVSRRTAIALDGLGRWANDWTWKVAGQATRSSLACEQDTRPTCGSAGVTRNQRGGTHPGKTNDSSFSGCCTWVPDGDPSYTSSLHLQLSHSAAMASTIQSYPGDVLIYTLPIHSHTVERISAHLSARIPIFRPSLGNSRYYFILGGGADIHPALPTDPSA